MQYLLEQNRNSEAYDWNKFIDKTDSWSSEDTFALKRPSWGEFLLKTQSWNIAKLNLKVIGFKSYFNGYIEDLEIYAEPMITIPQSIIP